MKTEPGRSVQALRKFYLIATLSRLRQIGVDAKAVLAEAGLDEARIHDPEAEIDLATRNRFWERAVAASQDPAFGLHLAESIGPGFFDVLGYLARSSPTLGEAFRRASRHIQVLHESVELQVSRHGELAWFECRFPAEIWLANSVGETLLACLLVLARQMTGVPDLAPLEVHTPSRPPADPSEWQRVFRAPVVFEARDCGLLARAEVLDLPILHSDPELSTLLDRYASDMLARLPRSPGLADRVREVLVAELRGGDPGLDRVARRLHMSSRTLRRRLRELGTSHQQLLDEVRRRLAIEYLKDPSLSVREVAFELGFSDPSSLRRLVKRSGGVPVALRLVSES